MEGPMVDEPENLVLTLLGKLGAKIDHVDAKTDRMAENQTNVFSVAIACADL
jgi:hypothetical protein